MSPYLRFVELCERLAKEDPHAMGRVEGLNIDGLSKNQLMQLYIVCRTWMNDYKAKGESRCQEKEQLFNRIKGLALETHEMRTNRDHFSKMKLEFMIDKHLELELVVTHFRDFVEKVAKMEWGLARSEARLREIEEEEEEEKPKSSTELEDFMKELKLADDLEGTWYADEFLGKIPTKVDPKKRVPISIPRANLSSHTQSAQAKRFQARVDDDDSDTSSWA